jgi:hypothetical protein
MSSKVVVFNMKPIPIVASVDGTVIGGHTTGEVDLADPRAQLAIENGFLALVAPVSAPLMPESTTSDAESNDLESTAEVSPDEVLGEDDATGEAEGVKPVRKRASKEN